MYNPNEPISIELLNAFCRWSVKVLPESNHGGNAILRNFQIFHRSNKPNRKSADTSFLDCDYRTPTEEAYAQLVFEYVRHQSKLLEADHTWCEKVLSLDPITTLLRMSAGAEWGSMLPRHRDTEDLRAKKHFELLTGLQSYLKHEKGADYYR